ncbi:hypothetical protein [Chlorogloeopsis fritschii]|uniref:hypothetical protein n=1 Tax=Chlorogloeopsis fritschii TaxID=1124 RepID=UPI0003738D14|nr:hypothetical protein [Chlorogloeopsis fritschii]
MSLTQIGCGCAFTLSVSTQNQVNARLFMRQFWQENPLHPSLHFKKVGKNLWSARVSSGYRALAFEKG